MATGTAWQMGMRVGLVATSRSYRVGGIFLYVRGPGLQPRADIRGCQTLLLGQLPRL